MKNLTLIIMAAGMGSRFGGLKQIEPVGPSGEIIADYSVYDALRAGFNKVIFIIRKENLEYFQNNISNKFSSKIRVEYAFQELDMIPDDVVLPEGREKMLGTGHALYCARHLIDGDFVVINADDFYGFDSYCVAFDFFQNPDYQGKYLTVNYPFCVTASLNGAVKRGVVFTDSDGYVTENLECEVSIDNEVVIAKSLFTDKELTISKDHPVTVNFFGFRREFLDLLVQEFNLFIHQPLDLKKEFLIPEIINQGIKKGNIKMLAKTSKSRWLGITYKEDLPKLKENITELIKKGEYPKKLWD